MWLNVLSGRTFLDREMYPIFPLLFYTGADGNRQVRQLIQPTGFAVGKAGIASCFDPFETFRFSEVYSNPSLVETFLSSQDLPKFFRDAGEGKYPGELCPEFFSFPEVFEGRALPPWADDEVDLVRQHITALEGESVGGCLHKWIDLIWGMRQHGHAAKEVGNSFDPRLHSSVWDFDIENRNEIEQLLATKGQIPIPLFTGPHPARIPRLNRTPAKELRIQSGSRSPILDFCILQKKSDNLKVVTVHSDDRVFISAVRGSFPAHVLPELRSFAFVKFKNDGTSTGFAFAQVSSNIPLFYQVESKTLFRPSAKDAHLTEVCALAVGKSLVVSASVDGSIYAWNTKMDLISTNVEGYSPITCMAVRNHCRTLMSCDKSGKLRISLLPNLDVMRVIDIGFIAKFVIMTQRGGTILVFGDRNVREYTYNGKFMGELEFAWNIVSVCALDMSFAVVNDKNQVLLYDAFSLIQERVVYEGSEGLGVVRVSRDCGMLCVSRSDGCVIVLRQND
jgi:hypothetical protein